MQEFAHQPGFRLRVRCQRVAQPPGIRSKRGMNALPRAEHHLPQKRTGTQGKGYHGPAHALPVGTAVHGGGVPPFPQGRRQQGCRPGRQHPVQLLFALHRMRIQVFRGPLYEREGILPPDAQKIQRQSNTPGINPGFLPRVGRQCLQEHRTFFGGKHHRHAAVAPCLQQGFFLFQRGLQQRQGNALQSGKQGGFPGAGR